MKLLKPPGIQEVLAYTEVTLLRLFIRLPVIILIIYLRNMSYLSCLNNLFNLF